jgi:PIN domain nuclease of toxin-antitoxin system
VIAYLDTHVAVWLYGGLVDRLSPEAQGKIEQRDLLLSPMALLELQYLYDRKRISKDAAAVFAYLSATFGIAVCAFPFPAIARAAVDADWTSDPFDRIIVGQAKANHNAMLITADHQIRRHYPGAVW